MNKKNHQMKQKMEKKYNGRQLYEKSKVVRLDLEQKKKVEMIANSRKRRRKTKKVANEQKNYLEGEKVVR